MMSANTTLEVLENILKDITKNKHLIEESAVLHDSLKSLKFKCVEDEIDSVEKTKSIIDQLNKNIIEYHNCFYKFYHVWKSEEVSCVGRNSSTEDGEPLRSKSPDVIDDSFKENGNASATEELIVDVAVTDSGKINTIENDEDKLQNNNESEGRKLENGNNKECLKYNENEFIENESKTKSHNEPEKDKLKNNKSQQNTSKTKENMTITKMKNKSNPNRMKDKELNQISIGNDCHIILEADSLENDKEGTCDKVSDTVSSPLDERYELNSLEVEKQNLHVDSHTIVDGTANSDEFDSGGAFDKETDLDPLNTQNSDDNRNDLCPTDGSPIKSETVAAKEEHTFKIKCVDITKLLEVSPIHKDTESLEGMHINASIVVISDSDNESSPKKLKKKNRVNITLPNLGKEITLTTVKTNKKIVVLNDSNSDEDLRNSVRSSKPELSECYTNKTKRVLRSSKNTKTNSENGRPTSILRRRPVIDISSVSSLSENSTSKTSESEAEVMQDRKKRKQKRRKISSVDDCSMLKDKKFSQKAYILLKRIPAEKLKENYEKMLVKGEMQKLTNMDNLKRSRRRDSKSSDSTESDNMKSTKRHCSKKLKDTSFGISSSEESNVIMDTDPLRIDDELVNQSKTLEQLNGEEVLTEALLNAIQSDDHKSKSSSDFEGETSDKDKKAEKKKLKEKRGNLEIKDADKNLNSDNDGNRPGNPSDPESETTRKKWRRDKLLTENITESDSDENFTSFLKKREALKDKVSNTEETSQGKQKKRLKKKMGKYVLKSSDSESSTKSRENSRDKFTSASESEKTDEETKDKKKAGRRRIRKIKDSSDETEEVDKSTRKNIRRVWARGSLAETTIAAEKEEKERKARIAERQMKYNLIFEADNLEKASVDKVVLDFDEKTEKELLKVDSRIVKNLKPHQAKGIQFMWDTCFESLKRAKETKGSGCILAHCMGLGKTLQVIALIHTLVINEEETGVRKILVVCPLSTVLNWTAEFKKWLPDEDEVNVSELVSFKQNNERMFQVKEWDRLGGVLVLGYDMFRNLTNPTNKRLSKKLRNTFHSCLVEPGPDLVICDEGHLLKNEKTSISIAMNRLHCMRRIVLTGTPLQNNLKEYFCMVQFVKPNLLGTYKEYLNRFVNPITNGQYTDSTPHDINIMRKRSHVLHKLLDGVVQRKDYSVLAPFLPPKHEYVLFVSLTQLQIKLYEHYRREKSGQKEINKGKSFLFVDFNEFQRICTHPRVLLNKSNEMKKNRDKYEILDDESEGSLKDFIDDDDTEKSTSSSANSSSNNSDSDSEGSHKKNKTNNKKRVTRSTVATYEVSDDDKNEEEAEPDPSEWWREYCKDEDLDDILNSGKLSLLFEILKHCEIIGDKILIFSQSLYSLNIIEYFLNKIDEATQRSDENGFCGYTGSWSLGLDYFRLDGTSSCDNRSAWCKTFNNPENTRARLFLISTRAGGLGINLVAANRVIIFDVSWNPSHDTQSIYRVYRFGQTKPSYIYRFVTFGTMEMKIYERQVTKQAISKRVIDEQQIDRHYNQSDLAELYRFEPVPEEERPIPLVPKDVLLGELLQADMKIYKYHEHQSLLENKVDEVLDEEERKAAWEEFENEKKMRSNSGIIGGYPVQALIIALQSVVRKEHPTWNADLIVQEANERFKRLEEEIATEGNDKPTLFQATMEIQILQAEQQQKYYEMLQQQRVMLQQIQRQQFLNQQMNRHAIPQVNNFRQYPRNYPRQAPPTSAMISDALQSGNPVDYIDLND